MKSHKNYLKDWSSVSVNEISREMVVEKYLYSSQRSLSQANKAMRHLSAVLNFCEVEDNPVVVLSQRRIRQRLKPKASRLRTNDISNFYSGLSKVKNESSRIYIKFLLRTGLRASEALSVTPTSFRDNSIFIPDTKNGSNHERPITGWLSSTLLPYIKENSSFKAQDIRRSLKTACCHLDYTLTRHDLRRTFASLAVEAGNDYLLVKRALNHRINDITSDYIQTSPETLRPVFESVASLIEAQLQAKFEKS